MQRRLCEMSEAKWSIAEAKCLQMSHNKYASQRDAISPLYGNLMLSHSAGMQHPDISIAGISKRFHFASLHYIFSAYLPTHIKFLTEFHRIFFGTTCISFPFNLHFRINRFLKIGFSLKASGFLCFCFSPSIYPLTPIFVPIFCIRLVSCRCGL